MPVQLTKMKIFFLKKVGNNISGYMPMWFYLAIILTWIVIFTIKAITFHYN